MTQKNTKIAGIDNDARLHSKELILSERINYTDLCGVYFLIKNGEIVYVGKSVNIYSRVSTHRSDVYKEFDSVSYHLCEESQISMLEARYIIKFNPLLNKTMPRTAAGLVTAKTLSYGWWVPLFKVEEALSSINPYCTFCGRDYYEKSFTETVSHLDIFEWRRHKLNIEQKRIRSSSYRHGVKCRRLDDIQRQYRKVTESGDFSGEGNW